MEDEDVVVIQLELRIAGDSLTGRAHGGSGREREFTGRLGLLATIDALMAAASPPATPPPPSP